MTLRQTSRLPTWLLLAAVLLTTCIYWPGLAGSYLFDDFPNVVDNPQAQVHTLDWRDWKAATLSSPSSDLRRPLSMLSFATNTYFTGLAPWPMKLTNLCIHLLNGVLLWMALTTLLRLPSCGLDAKKAQWSALGITAAWLVNPINLSGVLYVVQRMEALAQVFVLAGLWLYLLGRQRMLQGRLGLPLATAGILLGTGLGVLCKESAALLPLYAFLIEVAVLRFDAPDRAASQRLWAMYAILLLLPAVLGLAWILPRTLNPDAYAGRPFTLEQRLLTESRVLVGYASSTLFPQPRQLGFYHDDIPLSYGWLSPLATLLSAVALAVVVTGATITRRHLPLFALGVGWYFAAHLLTATIIPLELVFEHRNYFASIGLLMAAAALLLALPQRLSGLSRILAPIAIGVFSIVTAMRAVEWSNPVRFAYAEATEHPDSPRAGYELGRVLTAASGYRPDSRLIDPALQAFERASRLPGAGAAPLAALIVVSGHIHRPTHPEWWQTMTMRLDEHPVSVEDVTALQSILGCQQSGVCPPNPNALLGAFMAALGHPQVSARLLGAYGSFAANQLGDYEVAAVAFTDAAARTTQNTGYKLDLAKVLILQGKPSAAQQQLDSLDQGNLSRSEALEAAEYEQLVHERLEQP